MLEEGDGVEYETVKGPLVNSAGVVTLVDGAVYLFDEKRHKTFPAARVRMLRVWRAGVVVAEVQEVGAARGRRSEFVRARAGG
jgi:hypothetical protein